MATWEDLDNESESDEEDAEDEAKIAMALVAIVENKDESSDAESCADSKTETEVYSKLTRSELVDSIKELLGLYDTSSWINFMIQLRMNWTFYNTNITI